MIEIDYTRRPNPFENPLVVMATIVIAITILWIVIRGANRNGTQLKASTAAAKRLAEIKGAQQDGPYAIVRGRVRRRRAVSKAIAHVQIEGRTELFEIISYRWAIDRGDDLEMAVWTRDDGAHEALAHMNHTKGTQGVARPPEKGWFLIMMSIAMCWAVFPLFTMLPDALDKVHRGNAIRGAARRLGL